MVIRSMARSLIPSPNSSTPESPFAFASYMAASALASRVGASPAPKVLRATPTVASTKTSVPSRSSGSASAPRARSMNAEARRWASPAGSTNRARNPSPASRPRSSASPEIRRKRAATMTRTASPAACPHALLMALNRSRSSSTTATVPAAAWWAMARASCSSNCSRVGSPVNASPAEGSGGALALDATIGAADCQGPAGGGVAESSGTDRSGGGRACDGESTGRPRKAATPPPLPSLAVPSWKIAPSTTIGWPDPFNNSNVRAGAVAGSPVWPAAKPPVGPPSPIGNMVSAARCPTTSSRRQPNSDSASGFHSVTMPAESTATNACGQNDITRASSGPVARFPCGAGPDRLLTVSPPTPSSLQKWPPARRLQALPRHEPPLLRPHRTRPLEDHGRQPPPGEQGSSPGWLVSPPDPVPSCGAARPTVCAR